MIIPEEDSNAIIDNTDDYTDTDDDDNEEEIYKMTAIDFVVYYLLQDAAFAEYFFNRNRWDEAEQKYDIERKKLSQPAHRQPITVDMAAMRKAPKETGQRLFPALLQCVKDNPGLTAGEINSKLGRNKYLESAVYKCIEKNMDSFVRVPKRDIGGTRYLIYAREEMVTE
jgi:hypothetical protein